MGTTEMILYRSIDVWQVLDPRTVIRYRCFQILQGDRYCVQSADFYTFPIDERQARSLETQFLELLIEQPPDRRTITFASLEKAITHHNKEFGSMTRRVDDP